MNGDCVKKYQISKIITLSFFQDSQLRRDNKILLQMSKIFLFVVSLFTFSLVKAQTRIDYTSYDEKKSEYAKLIGEKLKKDKYINYRQFQPELIMGAADALDLPNKSIVYDLASEEQLLFYDAIPKSGAKEAFVRGFVWPINKLATFWERLFKDKSTNYLNSKKLDYGIGGQKVSDESGKYSTTLPSDWNNNWYKFCELLGIFSSIFLMFYIPIFFIKTIKKLIKNIGRNK